MVNLALGALLNAVLMHRSSFLQSLLSHGKGKLDCSNLVPSRSGRSALVQLLPLLKT